MDSLYSRFLGVGYKKETENIKNYGLSRSSSMPFYYSFQARKLPSIITGEIPIKKRNGGITTSDIKVQMLEEKVRNLENKQIQMTQTINKNKENQKSKENNENIPYIGLVPIQTSIIQPSLLMLNNNNDYNNYNHNYYKTNYKNLARSYELNKEIQESRYKLDKYRGLQKQDYNPNLIGYTINNSDQDYTSIFERQRNNKIRKEFKKHLLNNYYLEEEIKNLKAQKNARKLVNKLDEEIYSLLIEDFDGYMKNVNNNIKQQLKEDNIILNQDIDKVENDFNEIKNDISEKLKQMEIKQNSNFAKLKEVIRNVGGGKMSKAIQNVFEGKNYDLQKAEEEFLANEVFNLPNLINQKINEEEINNLKKEQILKKQIEEKMNFEFERQRQIEELKHREKIRLMEIEREKERIENLKVLNKLRYEVMQEKQDNYKNFVNKINNMNPYNYGMNQNNSSFNDVCKVFMMKKMNKNNIGMNNMNNNFNVNTDDLLKYMLMQKMGINNMNNMNMNNINNFSPGIGSGNGMINNNNIQNPHDYENNNNYSELDNKFNITENNKINEENKSIINENENNPKNNLSNKKTTNNSKKSKSKSKKSKSKKSESKKTEKKETEKKESKKESKSKTNKNKKETEEESEDDSKEEDEDDDDDEEDKSNKKDDEENEEDDGDDEDNEENDDDEDNEEDEK